MPADGRVRALAHIGEGLGMDTQPMRLTVELTYDDYVEAARAVQAINGDRAGRQARRAPAWVIIVPLFVALVLIVFASLNADPLPQIRPPLYAMVTLLLPALAVLTAIVALSAALRRGGRVRAGSRGGARRFGLVVASWALVVGLLVGLYVVLARVADPAAARAGAAAPDEMTDWYGTIAPHFVWLLLTVVLLVGALRLQARQLRVMWDGQARLRRPNDVVIDADGIAFDDRVSYRRHQWLAFTRYIETANLLLLCPSDVTFEVLPKRSFPSPEALAAARELFAAQVVDADKLSYAFPVATPPPLPSAASRAPAGIDPRPPNP